MPNKYPESYYLQQSYQAQNQPYGFNQQNQNMYDTLYSKYPSFEHVDNWLPDPQVVSDIEKGLRLTEKMETIEISSKDLSPSSCCSNIDLLLPDLYKNNTQWYYNNRSYTDYPSCSQIQPSFEDKNPKYSSMQNFDCTQYTQQQQTFDKGEFNYEKSDCTNIFSHDNILMNLTDVFPQQNLPFYSESSNNDSDIIVEESEDDFTQSQPNQDKNVQDGYSCSKNIVHEKDQTFIQQKGFTQKSQMDSFMQHEKVLGSFIEQKNSIGQKSLTQQKIQMEQEKNSLEPFMQQKTYTEQKPFTGQKIEMGSFTQQKPLSAQKIEMGSFTQQTNTVESYIQQKNLRCNMETFTQQKHVVDNFQPEKHRIESFIQEKNPIGHFTQQTNFINPVQTFTHDKSKMESFIHHNHRVETIPMKSFMQQEKPLAIEKHSTQCFIQSKNTVENFTQQKDYMHPMETFNQNKTQTENFIHLKNTRTDEIKSFMQQKTSMSEKHPAECFVQTKNGVESFKQPDECFLQTKNGVENFKQLTECCIQTKDSVENFKQPTECFVQTKNDVENFKQSTEGFVQTKNNVESFKQPVESFIQQKNPIESFTQENNLIESYISQNTSSVENVTQQKNFTFENNSIQNSASFNYVGRQNKQFDFIHSEEKGKFIQNGTQKMFNPSIVKEGLNCLQKGNDHFSQQKEKHFQQQQEKSGKFLCQNKIVEHENFVQQVKDDFTNQTKIVEENLEYALLKQRKISEGNLESEKIAQEREKVIPFTEGTNLLQEREIIEENFIVQRRVIHEKIVNESFSKQEQGKVTEPPNQVYKKFEFVPEMLTQHETNNFQVKSRNEKFESRQDLESMNFEELTNNKFNQQERLLHENDFQSQNTLRNEELETFLQNSILQKENPKCTICQIVYSPLEMQFYSLTEETPLTISSQKPVYSKLKNLLEAEWRVENYLCGHCLEIINMIDHLEMKLQTCKKEFYTKINKSGMSENCTCSKNVNGKENCDYCKNYGKENCDYCKNYSKENCDYCKDNGNLRIDVNGSDIFNNTCKFCDVDKIGENVNARRNCEFCKNNKENINLKENCAFCKNYTELLKLNEKYGAANKCKNCTNIRIEKIPKHKNYLCEICGRAFLRIKTLKMHLKFHTKKIVKRKNHIEAFTCKICKKLFRTRSNLKEHESYCSGLLNYKCKICAKKFATRTKLKNHVRLKHDKKFTSICSICNIGFVKISAYKSHMISHCSEKKYSCTICDKFYKTKSNLKFHMKFHEEKLPFNCSMCKKGFMRKEYLESHMASHTGEKNFRCSLCNKSFISQKNLDAHLKLHDGTVKRKMCNVCGKSISKGMEDHMRTHANLKEFECDSCELRFNTKGALLKHKKRKHNDDSIES